MTATWPDQPGWPERPGWPYPPTRPEPKREGPLMVPLVDLPRAEQTRRVFVSGPLDAETVVRVAAEAGILDP